MQTRRAQLFQCSGIHTQPTGMRTLQCPPPLPRPCPQAAPGPVGHYIEEMESPPTCLPLSAPRRQQADSERVKSLSTCPRIFVWLGAGYDYASAAQLQPSSLWSCSEWCE